jgi:hypothetical protein
MGEGCPEPQRTKKRGEEPFGALVSHENPSYSVRRAFDGAAA